MPHEGYADLVTNDGPRFHSDMPVSELAERDTQAIKASGISSTPSGIGNHAINPDQTLVARGLEPPDPDLGT